MIEAQFRTFPSPATRAKVSNWTQQYLWVNTVLLEEGVFAGVYEVHAHVVQRVSQNDTGWYQHNVGHALREEGEEGGDEYTADEGSDGE